MSKVHHQEWQEANQRYLMAALDLVLEELEEYQRHLDKNEKAAAQFGVDTSNAHKDLDIASGHLSTPSALETLEQMFGLTTFERKILLLCAGVELDARFGPLVSALNGAVSAVHPTFSLALAAFSDAHWSAVAPTSPLRYWRLIELNNGGLITKSGLKIDERVLHYLTGIIYIDERLRELTDPIFAEVQLAPSQTKLVNSIVLACTPKFNNAPLPVIQLTGDDKSDKTAIAATVCAALGLHLYNLPVFAISGNIKENADLTRLWNREAALSACALFLDCTYLDTNDKSRMQLLSSLLDNAQGVVILSSNGWTPLLKRPKIEFKVEKPSPPEQLLRWQNNLGAAAEQLNGQLGKVIAQFNLSAKTLDAASLEVLTRQAAQKETDPDLLAKDIWKTCCTHTRPGIDELAQRIEPVAGWDDLVLPEAQKQVLKEISMQVKHRNKIYSEWGFGKMGTRGLGISALFTGESGTGKTMASEVLANELQLDLYRIDLSQVVNKYIGETEKNLKRIFDAAEEGGAILLFDEADALFGKRSDVKDSHDRYSNIEVSYLLQRMESYAGLAVLTTNMKTALDKAFLRRIRFVIQFPYPDTFHRAEIWKRAFPANTPVQDLNIEKLAKLNVAGGNIRNIAMNAAFMAAEAGQPVQMHHIAHAARSEYNKLEKALSTNEIAGWQ